MVAGGDSSLPYRQRLGRNEVRFERGSRKIRKLEREGLGTGIHRARGAACCRYKSREIHGMFCIDTEGIEGSVRLCDQNCPGAAGKHQRKGWRWQKQEEGKLRVYFVVVADH